ncbi:NlpC/P60 family protein [Streptosporangium sp. NBC_01756]|uniref:NlpC/P60 family protein n=1 Tax=Streptosporangium sp. NBC_01756 TaxID=2975950 RepID=UPI002DDBE0CF|nr:NlpC/P60 family protein [Streptosporangium sp. NBC_01756]WSC83988.1 NlpC/P60 family protein [Streptosporangium sp. NBC_01756]
MITTVLTATVLATVLAVGDPQAPTGRFCSQVADAWRPLLSGAESPDSLHAWLREMMRVALVTACELGRTSPGLPAQTTRADAGDGISAPGLPRAADAAESSGPAAPGVTEPAAPPVGSPTGVTGITGSSGPPAGSSTDTTGPSGPPVGSSTDTTEPAAPPGLTSSGGTGRSAPPGSTFPDVTGPARPGSSSRVQRPADRSRGQRPADSSSERPPKSETSHHPSAVSRSPRRPSPGQTAVTAALRHVGRPYVWGGGSGDGPTGGGFDCSGLALHAWSKAGAALTHYTGSQFRQGRRVPFSQLRPGDLVFFGGGVGDPTHVGVYVKDGVMVHAPKTGDVVRTTNFADSPYYRSRYRGAVRPVSRTPA